MNENPNTNWEIVYENPNTCITLFIVYKGSPMWNIDFLLYVPIRTKPKK